MPVTRQQVQAREPSFFDKLKMGAIMGGSTGAVIGMLAGGMAIYQNGPGPNGYMRTMGQYMTTTATFLGLFMTVGAVIRSDNAPHSPIEWQVSFQDSQKSHK